MVQNAMQQTSLLNKATFQPLNTRLSFLWLGWFLYVTKTVFKGCNLSHLLSWVCIKLQVKMRNFMLHFWIYASATGDNFNVRAAWKVMTVLVTILLHQVYCMITIIYARFQCYVHSRYLSTSFNIHLSTSSFALLFEIIHSQPMHADVRFMHFYANEPQVQKVMLVGCDWWISIRLVC